jgi:hypothetical protein
VLPTVDQAIAMYTAQGGRVSALNCFITSFQVTLEGEYGNDRVRQENRGQRDRQFAAVMTVRGGPEGVFADIVCEQFDRPKQALLAMLQTQQSAILLP